MGYPAFIFGFTFTLLSTFIRGWIGYLPSTVSIVLGCFFLLVEIVVGLAWTGLEMNVRSSLMMRYALYRLIFASNGMGALAAWLMDILFILIGKYAMSRMQKQAMPQCRSRSSVQLYEVRMGMRPYGQAICVCSTAGVAMVSLLVMDIWSWHGSATMWIIGACMMAFSFVQIKMSRAVMRSRLMRYAGWNCYSFILMAYLCMVAEECSYSAICVLLIWMIVVRMLHPAPSSIDQLVRLALANALNDGGQLSDRWFASIDWAAYLDQVSMSCARGMTLLSVCISIQMPLSLLAVGWMLLSIMISWKFGRWTTSSLIKLHLLIYAHIVLKMVMDSLFGDDVECKSYACISDKEYQQNHCGLIPTMLCISIVILPLVNCVMRYCKMSMNLLLSPSEHRKCQLAIRYMYPPILLLLVIYWECIRMECIWLTLAALSIDILTP